jgi:hypothetical protein
VGHRRCLDVDCDLRRHKVDPRRRSSPIVPPRPRAVCDRSCGPADLARAGDVRRLVDAVKQAFDDDVDFAQVVKHYGRENAPENHRYSPAVCTGADKVIRMGSPDVKHIATSYVERSNLPCACRCGGSRLTKAFSKKAENHACAVALHFMHYNFARIHQTLRMTPAWQPASLTEPGRWRKSLTSGEELVCFIRFV